MGSSGSTGRREPQRRKTGDGERDAAKEGLRPKRQFTPEERRQAVEAYRSSGLTQKAFAKQWGVSHMTIHGWAKRYEAEGPKGLERLSAGPAKRRGRAPLAEGVRAEIEAVQRRFPTFGLKRVRDWLRRFAGVRERVVEQVDEQGVGAGEVAIMRGIKKRLAEETKVSLLLVREELAAEKRRRRARTAEELAAVRESHDVLARDALWCHDGTHLGRDLDGSEVVAEVIKDRGTLATAGISVGGPITAKAALALFDHAAQERRGWPLAIQEDNAKIHDAVDRAAAEHRCVVLRSRVHTPTDNPTIEHHNHELKVETGLGKGVVLDDATHARARLSHARRCLDHGRLRATRGWMTADELDRALPRGDAIVDRAVFYAVTTEAMDAAERDLEDRDERCLARQRAFWTTAERFGLARTHVGPRPRVRDAPTPCRATREVVQ